MRVALIFATEQAGHTGASRAMLRVGGVALARHQLGLALALGCERVICVAPVVDADLVGLQHVTEAGGARFQGDAAKGIGGTIGEAHGGVYLEGRSFRGYLAALTGRRPMAPARLSIVQ